MTEHFVIAGAQRCGTSFLYRLLDAHAEIEMARPLRPEPRFFLRSRALTRERYAALFAGKPTARWRGEKSASYIEHPEVAERILELLPECRILFVLRDPVERAISNYWFSVAEGAERAPIAEAFLREEERRDRYARKEYSVSPFAYLARGEYARWLAPFVAAFPGERLKVVLFERLVESAGELAAVLDFLGVPAADAGALLAGAAAVNAAPRGGEIPAELRRELAGRFAASNRELAAFTGLDLSPWDGARRASPATTPVER